MADLRAPRGMHDLLPEDEGLFEHVVATATRVARSFDYHLIRTPIVEDASVFLRTVGDESDIVSKEMYVFEDRGGDRLALRPEGTAGVARAYLEHGMASRPQPVRLFYWGPFFRYDRPQAGRYRQLHQFGVECIGDPSPEADVEVIELQREIYRALGLTDLVLRVNSIGTPSTRRTYEAALREHFRPHLATLSADSRRRFETNVLRILDSKEDAAHEAVRTAPSILEHLSVEDMAHWDRVCALLDELDIAYEVDPSIVRGLDYYTHTVWEFEPRAAGGQSTIGAGGRYDGLIETLGGPHTPGVGWATGLERLMLALGGEASAPSAGLDAITVPLGASGAAACARLATALRREGLLVRNGTAGRSMRAALRTADGSGARFALIIGDREAASGVVQVKPLTGNGEQSEVPLAEVAARIRAR
ncbi:MAG: histidine--tRNA ligase [Dehalococcoidia bacterium]